MQTLVTCGQPLPVETPNDPIVEPWEDVRLKNNRKRIGPDPLLLSALQTPSEDTSDRSASVARDLLIP